VNDEDIIRRYLLFLEDPNQLVDAQQITALEAAAEEAGPPLDKLRAFAALDRARSVDGSQARDDFVRVARGWAEREGIPTSAFRQLGVGDEVLAEAGFDGVGRRRGRRSVTRKAGAGTGRTRSQAVSTGQIEAWVLARTAPFTTSDIALGAGGSPVTIKKVLDQLLASGKVDKLGPAKDWPNRGRVPIQYALSS
jgi:hypothetical protein